MHSEELPIQLDPGEEVIFTGRRHWIIIVRNSLGPGIVLLLAGGAALLRAIGLTFFSLRSEAAAPITDPLNLVLIIIAALLVFIWSRESKPKDPKAKKKPGPFGNPRWLLLVVAALLAVIVGYRLQGGLIVTIDPNSATPTDALNIALMVIAAIAVIYLIDEWHNDLIIATTRRVLYDEVTLFIRHQQQQILIEDIQQINTQINTYPAVVLGYGMMTFRTYSPRPLKFNFVNNPKRLEAAVMGEVGKLRRQQGPELLRTLIEDQVFGKKGAPPRKPTIHIEQSHGLLAQLFPPNPSIQGETIVWRPDELYILLQMLRAIGSLLGGLIAVTLLAMGGVLSAWLTTLLAGAVLLVCGGWAWWIRERLINDTYILTPMGIADIDRDPFGPERARRAQLSAIQDISFDISFIESLLGYGTVVIETGGAAGGKFTFDHVPDPRGVQETINDYLVEFRKRDRERQLQDSLQLLKQYEEVQRARGEKLSRADLEALVAVHASSAAAQYVDAMLPDAVEHEVRSTAQVLVARLARVFARARLP